MAGPVISWYNDSNTAMETSWSIGPVDAGTTSSDKTFLIWNNRGQSTAVTDIKSCAISTKDISGGDTGELVTDKWIKVRVDSMAESTFTAIGGSTSKEVKGGGTAPAGVIKGGVNDGTIANAAANFAKVTVHATPPPTATAGNVDFLLRLTYSY